MLEKRVKTQVKKKRAEAIILKYVLNVLKHKLKRVKTQVKKKGLRQSS